MCYGDDVLKKLIKSAAEKHGCKIIWVAGSPEFTGTEEVKKKIADEIDRLRCCYVDGIQD